MGLLVNGEWHTDWYDTSATDGEFVRQDAQFRHTITRDGSGDTFKAEPGRYHLYVSLACPWAHRTLIMRQLKKLEALVGVTVVKPEMLEHGWELSDLADASPVPGIRYLHEVYTTAQPNYSGRVTVPVLWDKKTATIVNNESAEIMRILNSGFNDFTAVKKDYYPIGLRAQIDTTNDIIYHNINNGVYKCGFATTQKAYDTAFENLFNALDHVEQRLGQQRYLLGAQITEADWRLFTTLVRFDPVYFGHFKCNRQQIEQFPNLSNYLRDLFQQPGIAETVDFAHIKTHYYYSHETINPTRIVPLGPQIDYLSAHDRHRFDTRQAGA